MRDSEADGADCLLGQFRLPAHLLAMVVSQRLAALVVHQHGHRLLLVHIAMIMPMHLFHDNQEVRNLPDPPAYAGM